LKNKTYTFINRDNVTVTTYYAYYYKGRCYVLTIYDFFEACNPEYSRM